MPETCDGLLTTLNDAQKRAVTSTAATVAILAGPGSGKTHTLTSRVVWLIQRAGYQPSDIIVATFTVKAAREMRERIGKNLGDHVERKIVLGTFHSIARRYLAAYGNRIGLDPKFGIADDGDSKAIIARICKRLDLKVEPSYAKSWISKRKAAGSEPNGSQAARKKSKLENPALTQCYEAYQEQLKLSNLLDYDDLLVRCVELLKQHPSCVSNVQAVLIDEYQDTNGIQYELMRLFSQSRQRITVVGDPDQSIYGWRSAEIRNLYRLLRQYPETDEISLEENYRSSQMILDTSLQVIQQDKKRYQKCLKPVHTKGARPVLRTLKSAAAEAEWIVTEIKRTVLMFGGMLKHEDVAILLRSAALSRHIESALGKEAIPYQMIGGHKFYDRKEIKILLDYLRVIYQPDNNDAVARVINVPRRGIGEKTIKDLLEEAERSKLSLWTILRKHCQGQRKAATTMRPKMEQALTVNFLRPILALQQKAASITESSQENIVDLIQDLCHALRFQPYLENEYPEDHENRWANVQELVNLAADFMRDTNRNSEEFLPEIDEVDQRNEDSLLGRFLSNIALASDAQKNEENGDKSSLVTISTIHAAKGLEWPVVFVPAVYTGSIPHSRSEDLDEERRLLYVAMTRAKALLNLSCPLYGSQGNSGKVELSQFVSEMASKAFLQKGPSFDRHIVIGVAKILGRKVVSEEEIFGKLPKMFSIEDDRFPVDPADPRTIDGCEGEARPLKRQRTHTSRTASSEIQQEPPWGRDYTMTMEDPSSFTAPAGGGFTTAAQHQSTLDAAAEKAAAAAAVKASSRGPARGSNLRGTGQRSLLGFVTKTSMTNTMTRFSASTLDVSAASQSKEASSTGPSSGSSHARERPAIDPVLAGHRLKSPVKSGSKPRSTASSDGPTKKYACFSSSPVRPATDEDSKDVPPDTSQPDNARQPIRPISSFHTTTFGSLKANGGVRRPVGLGPPPTMDRLSQNRVRKPFKPLTINRPSGPK